MKFKKWRKREKVSDIYVLPGDTITLSDHGKEQSSMRIGREMTIGEVGVFDAEVEGRDTIGGAFISKK